MERLNLNANYKDTKESVVQLGPSSNPKPKPKVWTKANTKVTFKPTPTHPPTQTFLLERIVLGP